MTYRYLTDLADVLVDAGLSVVEVSGWKTRGRPASTGGFDPRGIVVHHTGGTADTDAYVNWMTLDGRTDLPAPLCQLALSRRGTVYVCAAGRANHAGTARATGPMPATSDGNGMYLGIEAMNTGSEGWSPAQYDAYVAMCAALCNHYGWPATHVRAHRETSTTGKWDPGLLDMDKFRNDIATRMEDDMAQHSDTLDKILEVAQDTRKAIGELRKKEAQRYQNTIKEMRAQGRTADEILAAVEAQANEEN